MGYENGKIYKLWSNEGDDIYIGSTINTLTKRLNQHKNQFKKGHYLSSFSLYDKYENVQIELIENFPCKDKNELTAREGYHIRNTNCVNKQIPCRSYQEYYNDNKEHILQYQKEYVKNNKEKIVAYRKKYTNNHQEEKKEYDKERRKLTCYCKICDCELKKAWFSAHIKSKKHILNSSV